MIGDDRSERTQRFVHDVGQRLISVLVEPSADRHTEHGHGDVDGKRRRQLIKATIQKAASDFFGEYRKLA
jgi:hypothetical protein